MEEAVNTAVSRLLDSEKTRRVNAMIEEGMRDIERGDVIDSETFAAKMRAESQRRRGAGR